MEIHCPNCKVVYRVDETRIPDKGAYTRCKKCQTRFLVQKATEKSLSETDSIDMNGSSNEEKMVQNYIANNDLDLATKLLLDLITKFAKKKKFSKAESLRDKLDQSIPLALNEIVKANEVIEKEKTISMDQAHLELWDDLYQSLSPSETVELYYSMKEIDTQTDKAIFNQGDKKLNLYFIEKGILALSINNPKEEKQVVLKELEAGSAANTAAFFLSTICTFALIAKTESKIKYLEKEVLIKWEEAFPRMVSELNRFCMSKEDISGLIRNSEQNRRAHQRLQASLKAEIQYLDHVGKPFGKKMRVMLSDISEGGLCYESMITKRESANRLLENQVIAEIFYQTSAGVQKEIRKGDIVAVNIIPFSTSTIHVQFNKFLAQAMIESIKQTVIEG